MTELWKTKAKDLSRKVTLSYTITYNMNNKSMQKQFLDYCDDHEPTEGLIAEWLTDRFIDPCAIDPKAKFKIVTTREKSNN
jgi:hypothetical protein